MIDQIIDNTKIEGVDYDITHFDWFHKDIPIKTREFATDDRMQEMNYESYLTRFKLKYNREFSDYRYYVVERTQPGCRALQITLVKVKRSVG